LQEVTNCSSGRRVSSDKHFRSARVTAQADVLVPLHSGTDIEKVRVLVDDLGGSQLLQGADVVKDVDSATVRAYHQIVLTRVNDQIVDANSRQAGHEFFPLLAAVDRNI